MRDDPIETIEYRGHTIEIYPDYDRESPRLWDNLGKLRTFHKRYDLGDLNLESVAYLDGKEYDLTDPFEFQDWIVRAGDQNLIVYRPVYLYDHSVQHLSTRSFVGRVHHAEWDSRLVGYIYVERERILSEYGGKRLTPKLKSKVLALLDGEIETFDIWGSGSIVGYVIPGLDDSVWGYYSVEDAVADAKSMIDWYEDNKVEAHAQTIKHDMHLHPDLTTSF